MHASASRVAVRWLAGSALWTVPYLQKLVDALVSDPNGWGEGSPGARVLRKMIMSAGIGNLDPFPIEELWSYLLDRDVAEDELQVVKKVPVSRKPAKKKGPAFSDVWRAFERETGKSTILTGIDLDDPKADLLVPALQAATEAVSRLPQHAARLWDSQVKKVRFRATSRGSEDASWETGGTLSLSLAKAVSVPIWRSHITHELGHALEEKLHLRVNSWGDLPYGKPPFVSDYAEVNASEDFAETFRAFELESGHLRSKAPFKFTDMSNRVR